MYVVDILLTVDLKGLKNLKVDTILACVFISKTLINMQLFHDNRRSWSYSEKQLAS